MHLVQRCNETTEFYLLLLLLFIHISHTLHIDNITNTIDNLAR